MAAAKAKGRRALLAGATGLVGRELLALLLRSHASVEVLVRRATPGLGAAKGLRLHVVDFAHLPESLPAIDDAFIALGTTIKVAGSQAAFRGVDFVAVVGRELLALLLRSHASVEVLVRRATPGLGAAKGLRLHVVDFAHLPEPLPAIDDAFIALGTTIKVAGSQAAFRSVDFAAVVATAQAAKSAGATRLAVVSALGADPASSVFYNRVKGEMEAAVGALGFSSVVIARPSLLLGDRAALGQPVRAGEAWATRLFAPFQRLVPAGVRPIEADAVAAAMVDALAQATPGVRILSSKAMQR